MKPLTAAFVLLMAAASSASAQESTPTMGNDLTVTMGSRQNAICPDAPPEPEWIAELHPREAWKGYRIQKLYQFRRDQQIVATGSCACDVRFPSWEAVEAEFEERYAAMSNAELLSAFSDFADERNEAKMAARAICQDQR